LLYAENFPLGGDFASKLPFSGCIDESPCHRPTLFDLAKPSIY